MPNTPIFRLISQFDDKRITVTEPQIVGRQKTNDLVLPYDSISREHARLSIIDNQATVEDLGSSNGTFLNGERITKTVLTSGDILAFDQYSFQVDIQHPALSNSKGEFVVSDKTDLQTEQVVEKEHVAPGTEVIANIEVATISKEPVIQEKPSRSSSEKINDKPVKQTEKAEKIDANTLSTQDSEQQSTGNWWEKGDSGPKSTMFMDPLDTSSQGLEQANIPDKYFDEPVLYGVSESVTNTIIQLQQGTMMVGRSDECDYIIDSKHISDKHAQLVFESSSLKVIGMPNTTNGTFVNGNKVGGGMYLQSGDILSFGPIEFKVMLPENTNRKNQNHDNNVKLDPSTESNKMKKSWLPILSVVLVVGLSIFAWFIFK